MKATFLKLSIMLLAFMQVSCFKQDVSLYEIYPSSKKLYVSPSGEGDGKTRNTPLGDLADAIGLVSPGDTVVLLDGEYPYLLIEGLNGTVEENITIKAENICGAFFNGEITIDHAIVIDQSSFVNFEGIKAGNTKHSTWKVTNSNHLSFKRCAGFNAGYLVAQDGASWDGMPNGHQDNCHVFDIAYSDNILAEDVWAWGTGRYLFMYFQCENSTVRRGVFRPTATELGYGYDRAPHAGFNLYSSANCIAENCVVFETRIHPQSDHDAHNEWGIVQGGMVFDDKPTTTGYNYVLGCFDLNNGNWRTDVPRSNSAVHLMGRWSGKIEDVVIWKNAHNYNIVSTTSGHIDYPTRALIGGPANVRQDNAVTENLKRRYVNGVLTTTPLWPWPYEETIKAQMGMDETMTEYVHRMVEPHLDLR